MAFIKSKLLISYQEGVSITDGHNADLSGHMNFTQNDENVFFEMTCYRTNYRPTDKVVYISVVH